MDWLTRLPVIGPAAARVMRTHAWRAYETLDRVHWTRLAAAITFISFLALFPLITVGAAIGAAVLSDDRMAQLERKLAEQVPGISGQLDLSGLVENAATVGSVAGALLLLTGIGWVGSLRECLRAVWELEEDPGNPVARKVKDAGVLIGLGGVALSSFAVSTFAVTAVGWGADHMGLAENGPGGWLLRIAAFAAAVAADVLLLGYVLTLLPGVQPPRRTVITAALIGAIGFELLKLLLSSYLQGVAAKSMYGAFGVPIALLLWINLTAKLTLYCAAWTATGDHRGERPDQRCPDCSGPAEPSETTGPAASPAPAAPGGAASPGPRGAATPGEAPGPAASPGSTGAAPPGEAQGSAAPAGPPEDSAGSADPGPDRTGADRRAEAAAAEASAAGAHGRTGPAVGSAGAKRPDGLSPGPRRGDGPAPAADGAGAPRTVPRRPPPAPRR